MAIWINAQQTNFTIHELLTKLKLTNKLTNFNWPSSMT
jgi:hypothetical protein